ncbi:MAG: UbiD family decarboxylase [Candidatus Heimdallarchaeota archaeon]|nr:UbiD family decarboxylase [Candidatus Heimdallarchaeota archaeon]
MSLRPYLEMLKESNFLVEIHDKVKQEYEITEYLQTNNNKTVLFTNVEKSHFPLIGNSLTSREQLKFVLNEHENYYSFFQQSLINPKQPTEVETSLTFSNKKQANFSHLPIPKFFPGDGGRYLSSVIVFAQFPNTDAPNMSIHRIMVLDNQRGTMRIVPRDLHKIFLENKKNGLDTPIAVINGYHPILALAASSPTPSGKSELDLANSLMKGELSIVQTPRYGISVPSDVEFILEGRILAEEETVEGPFVDITGTFDDIRNQPIVQFDDVLFRDNAIFQTILPAYEEHFILMGFPREAEIHNCVSKIVPKVHGVYLTPSGCGWLNAVISVTTENAGDAKKVGLTAFQAHPSLKWCTVVNEDIDIYNNKAVEWARITRAGTNDITILKNIKGSSLDPSRNRDNDTSIKVIIDATKKKGKTGYDRVIPF